MASWQAWKHRVCAALVFGAMAVPAAHAIPVLTASATPDPAVVGAPVSVDLVLTDVVDLYAYQLSLSFDPSLLQVTGVAQGALLPGGGSTFFDGGSVNNTLGSISFMFDSLVGGVPGVNGTGVLATVSFDVVGTGTSTLAFADTLFLDSGLADISVQITNGSLQTLPVPEPASFLMFGMGLAAIAVRRYRKPG